MLKAMRPRLSSASRRAEVLQSAGPRARSQERSLDDASALEKYLHEDTASSENEDDTDDELTHFHRVRRAVSDPLDSTEDRASEHEPKLSLPAESFPAESFPTLPRFPVGQTHDKNCWSEPDEDIFQVRGASYLEDKKKVVSGPFLMRARGSDLLLTEGGPPTNVGRFHSILGGALRTMPTFIINFRFPWGVLVLYFEIPSKLCPFLLPNPPPIMDDLTTPEQTLAKFFMGDEDHKNSSLKLIPYCAEGPWIARSMVTGKPAIIGNKLPVTYTYTPASGDMAEYLEADLDIGSSSKAAKKIVSVCRRYMNALTVDIGFVIQGNSEEELPEQMMGSIRLHGVDPLKATTLR